MSENDGNGTEWHFDPEIEHIMGRSFSELREEARRGPRRAAKKATKPPARKAPRKVAKAMEGKDVYQGQGSVPKRPQRRAQLVQRAHRMVYGSMLKDLQKKDASPDNSNGVMIALTVPDTVKSKITITDGLPEEELHLTLVYLGKLDQIKDQANYFARVLESVQQVADNTNPIKGVISGIGRFDGDDKGKDPLYLSYDSTDLSQFRAAIVEALKENGVEFPENHGFTPHITISYIDKGQEVPLEKFSKLKCDFNEVSVYIGETIIPISLTGEKLDNLDSDVMNKFPDSGDADL